MIPLLCGGAGGGLGEIRQAGEIAFLQHHRKGFLVGQNVLTELCSKTGETLVDGGEPLLRGQFYRGPGADEAGVVALQYPRLFSIEAQGGATPVEVRDAGVERTIEIKGIVVAGEQWRDVALYGLDVVRGIGARQNKKHAGNALELTPAPLQGLDRILEAGRVGIGGDRINLGA